MAVLLGRHELGWSYLSPIINKEYDSALLFYSLCAHMSHARPWRKDTCVLLLPNLWLGHPLTFLLFPITWTCLCGFQGDWTNTLAAYYDWLLSAIIFIRCTVVFGSKDRLCSPREGQIPWVKGQHIQFPAVRVAEAYDSTSAIQQCLLCSLTLIHPQELITNVPIYTYSSLAYSSLHILNVSPSCSFTVSSSVPASSPLQL